VGKTAAAIRVCELSKAQHILVVTKKAAIDGWHSELERIGNTTKDYTIVNYEQVKNLCPSIAFNLAIIDESHTIGRAGKPTQRLKDLKKRVLGLPILLLTGTPAAETHLSYYYQFSLSKHSPFPQNNFYDFFRVWGIPQMVRINGRFQETYKKAKPEIIDHLEPYIVPLTQQQAGIQHIAQDKLHVVPLDDSTKALIKTIQEDGVAYINGDIVAFESDIAERLAVHQIEYGALKIDDNQVLLSNNEVVHYLFNTFGDTPDVGFMVHYHSTRLKLAQHFKHAQIFSSNAHSEGVNLSHLKHFVIVNSDFSGAKFIQRRERITNLNRTTAAVVHHIVTDAGISNSVYAILSNKKDFTLSLYRKLRNAGTRRTTQNNKVS